MVSYFTYVIMTKNDQNVMFVILSSSLHSLEKNTKREMLVTIIEYYNLEKKKKKKIKYQKWSTIQCSSSLLLCTMRSYDDQWCKIRVFQKSMMGSPMVKFLWTVHGRLKSLAMMNLKILFTFMLCVALEKKSVAFIALAYPLACINKMGASRITM